MLDKETAILEKIAKEKTRLNKYRPECRQIVQGIYNWYILQQNLDDLPEHIKKAVKILDKHGYGKDQK